MESPQAREKQRSQGGVALFMVVSAVAVLSLLVTEFTYLAQLNQKIAFDALDQVKVHYLAKSALKLSLLRLKAYQQVKALTGKDGAGSQIGVPRAVIEKIWNFPFVYPLPAIPGMSMTEKDNIDKFQKESTLDGSFTARIESESSKYNLNLLLSSFVPKAEPTQQKEGSPATPTAPQPPATGTNPQTPPAFDPDAAQKSLTDYLQQILNSKVESDPDFGDEYRDLRVDELTENIRAWVDPTYEKTTSSGRDGAVATKKAPFYTLSELHMIPMMDDELYELFSPSLTASPTPGININSANEATIRALFPAITKDEVTDLLKQRDSEEEDNKYKAVDDFYKSLSQYSAAYRSEEAVQQTKTDLTKRNIRLVIDETQFKIIVRAEINQSTRLIEAWVTLLDPKKSSGPQKPRTTGIDSGEGMGAVPPAMGSNSQKKSSEEAGLKITFMRIL